MSGSEETLIAFDINAPNNSGAAFRQGFLKYGNNYPVRPEPMMIEKGKRKKTTKS